jgi:hypothetical protein
MYRVIRHWHQREIRFLLMAGTTLLFIALFLWTDQPLLEGKASSWRKIDLEAFQQRLQGGDLSDREAQWYHPARAIDGDPKTKGATP